MHPMHEGGAGRHAAPYPDDPELVLKETLRLRTAQKKETMHGGPLRRRWPTATVRWAGTAGGGPQTCAAAKSATASK
jgi:hypothetical protein